jgi:predicted glycosyltransferase
MTRARVFFYVQHLLGIGHLRRAAAITRALERQGLAVAFVAGGEPVPGLDLGGAEMISLPPARAGDSGFNSIVDADGRPIDDAWRERRRSALLAAFERTAPAAVLIELYPFGRRPFRFELRPLLDAAAAQRPRPAILCSVRDILVSKSDPQRTAEIVEIVRRSFDLVLVHGDPRLIEFGATFAGAGEIADRLRYTGYVVGDTPEIADSHMGEGEILVSAGGGVVGAPLLRAAIGARALTRVADRPWRLIAGPNLPEPEFRALAAAAGPNALVERFRTDFQTLLRNCRLSVSQAGYNTVMELLAAGTRAVVVPFAEGGETEQPVRARLLAERGLLTVVDPDKLTPETLAAGIDAACRSARPIVSFDLSGADGTARAIIDAIEQSKLKQPERPTTEGGEGP